MCFYLFTMKMLFYLNAAVNKMISVALNPLKTSEIFSYTYIKIFEIAQSNYNS